MKEFVHLHVHTEYSLLDGACRIPKLMERVKEVGQTAVAITDHGVMYGVIDFYKAAKQAGVKPIIGCEVYVAPRTRFDKTYELDGDNYHLVLLCKNQTGYQNLIYLDSMAFTEGFYNRPRIDFDLLSQHADGLICLSACLAGEVQQLLLNGNYDGAKAVALRYADLFGPGNYYLELQDHGIEEQARINPLLLRLSRETGIPLVATNDAHYLRKKDAKSHDVLLCVQTGKTMDDEDRMRFTGQEFYIKSGDEMAGLFPYAEQAIANTRLIADQCELEFDFSQHHLPKFPLSQGEDPVAVLTRKCREGFEKRYPDAPEEVRARLQYEIDMISQMGFVDYFLIVGDFIAYAKDKGIPVGPGRGSAAGSMVAYCLGITELDPIEYSLYFERFLNPARVSMPDIDIDFCYIRRQEVIDYVIEKYGADRVSQIITFGTMAARAAIRDVGRAMGMSYAEVDVVAKLVPQELKITLDKAMESSPDLKRLYEDDERVKTLLDMARELEGMPRNASTHAAGIIITSSPVYDYVPLAKNEQGTVTQFGMVTLEELGLLKMDFLGLRNLTILSDAVKLVNRDGPRLDLERIDLHDQAVYDMLSMGKTSGVFQLESSGMTGVTVAMKPRSIEDITAIVALFRPGPMASIGTYIDRMHHPERIRYKHPLLKDILSVTYGCIVYQEQVMETFRLLAGYSLGRADMVRRAMSKKKFDVLNSERDNFVHGNPEEGIKGCVHNGVDEKTANDIFDEMLDFANYAFNKAHAVCYALLAYQTAYLKYHFPKEYMAALLTSVLGSTTKVSEYISQCKEMGIGVLPPDVNESDTDFSVSGDDIRFGLAAVKNVGRGFIVRMVAERQQGGRFADFDDFCRRMTPHDLNKRMVESLIKCGAFDSLGALRSQLMQVYSSVLDAAANDKKKNLDGQIDLFSGLAEAPSARITLPAVPEFSTKELLVMEKETLGMYLSGHPMEAMAPLSRKAGAVPIGRIYEAAESPELNPELADGRFTTIVGVVASYKLKTTKKGTNMAYITLEDISGAIELLAFSNVLAKSGAYLSEDSPVIVYGRISAREEEEPKLVCEEVYPLSEQMVDRYLSDRRSSGGRRREKASAPQPKRDDKPKTLHLRVPDLASPELDRAKAVLHANPGDCPVIIYTAEGKKYKARQDMWVRCSESLLKDLAEIVSLENVTIQ